MPGFNGTGPVGAGPMTGRGMGPCGQGQRMGYGRRGFGRGGGMTRGACYGFAGGGYYRPSQGDLENEASALEEELKMVKDEINEMKKKK